MPKMKLFSERRELKTVRDTFQVDSVDIKLRTRLWNCLYQFYFKPLPYKTTIFLVPETLKVLTFTLWDEYFGLELDDLGSLSGPRILDKLKTYFLEEAEWYEVYDFLEFIMFHCSASKTNKYFKICCNKVLEDELSAYRFVGNQITQITSESEISEVEEALKSPITAVKTHLERALELLSDKEAPDYRNSIKESICAVEAISRDPHTGATIVDSSLCIGCRVCNIACPVGGASFDPSEGVAVICDLCGGEPLCAMLCPTGAVSYTIPAKAVLSKKRLAIERLSEILKHW